MSESKSSQAQSLDKCTLEFATLTAAIVVLLASNYAAQFGPIGAALLILALLVPTQKTRLRTTPFSFLPFIATFYSTCLYFTGYMDTPPTYSPVPFIAGLIVVLLATCLIVRNLFRPFVRTTLPFLTFSLTYILIIYTAGYFLHTIYLTHPSACHNPASHPDTCHSNLLSLYITGHPNQPAPPD